MLALPEGFLRGFSIVVAHDADLGIGKDEYIPWQIPEDLQRFKEITTALNEGRKPAVLMGMNTWESLRTRPLPGRDNVIVSRKYREIPEVLVYKDFLGALASHCKAPRGGNVFVIGGGQIYSQALTHPALATMYVTEVKGSHGCNIMIPEYQYDMFVIEDVTKWLKSSRGESYRFIKYTRI